MQNSLKYISPLEKILISEQFYITPPNILLGAISVGWPLLVVILFCGIISEYSASQ